MDQATIKSYYDQLEGIYAPQRQVIQQQVAQLPGVFETQKSGLEQAKMNAFRDISSKARGMGVAFGGYSPSEQARYTGTTYMPALANLQASQNQQQTSLQSALASLYGEQQSKALGYAESAAQAAAKNAAAIEAARIKAAATQNAAAIKSQASTLKGFKAVANKVKGKTTGTSFFGPNNRPITAAQYYSNVGTLDDLYTFLATDADKTSQRAAKDLAQQGAVTPALVKKYPWIFGG